MTTRTRTKKKVIQEPVKVASVKTKPRIHGEPLYEMYAGRYARAQGCVGVICGHSGDSLVMAVMMGMGWHTPPKRSTIVKYLNHKKGYCYANEDEIID